MFDIGFTEIIIICLVGLIVIGPSRLPETLRTLALWLGRSKRKLASIRRDLENEIGIDEIRRDLRNEQIMADLESDNLAEKTQHQPPPGSQQDTTHEDGQHPAGDSTQTRPEEATTASEPTDNKS